MWEYQERPQNIHLTNIYCAYYMPRYCIYRSEQTKQNVLQCYSIHSNGGGENNQQNMSSHITEMENAMEKNKRDGHRDYR